MEGLTSSVTHVIRLLRWGRTLARYGALQGVERDPLTPPIAKRLVKLARSEGWEVVDWGKDG